MAAHANRGTARKHRRTDKFRKMGGKTSNKRRPRTSTRYRNTRRRTRSLYGGVDNARRTGYTTDATSRWPQLRTPSKPVVFTLPGKTPAENIRYTQLTPGNNGNPPLFSVEMNGQERITAATPVPFIGDINPFARDDEPRR